MRRLGFVVNPIAGMGGRVGLKGTDGKVEEARARGAEMRAPDRAGEMLTELADTGAEVTLYTWGGLMGEAEAVEHGFDPEVLGRPEREQTTPEDTRRAVRAFLEADLDLVLFVGGDGTAADVAETIADAGGDLPILGVPAGVKVYSAVFAVTPEAAAHVAVSFDSTERAEVNDIDEDEYREGEVHTELRALATVPVAPQRQGGKQLSGGTVEGLAEGFAEDVEPGRTYILGPGGTLGTIKEKLGIDGTALGVDVYRDGEVLVSDGAADDIAAVLGERNTVVVSPIGGQGFIFGRGNQQISPEIIRNSEIEIVASRRKLEDIGALRVDTGDEALDESLRGWQRVRVGRYETRLMEVL
ncbi:N-acetylglucosamine-1-phosphate uridyltransferase [Halovenus sp. WSH3]|uniref:N-acetylglucosamine-1-phosphate uridyltransferase n=1 Tax=Halovenus carboxidivorans TaxID=2692199 RepID=A0A6B0T8W8_9EURY|nr:ATP-NAD kinase family protein [Halovenus carboxidivorans]MXR52686.1 N-acetylglucosamine-1-phosphate uridyltransferase [Halovenus carboxidivorans]